ncbi:hypothetical protein [Flagellimonas sp. S3867]|uniref:hypothetical protein n=1 Tax=Flagellimonas sp. S3867 TaxID=2768063 RepID=UPI001689CC9B|nr:hypothetical protein [Flagellimonas sp. S3867]
MSGIFCSAQKECALGIGGGNDDSIAEVFQLNELQLEKLKNWSAELKIRNELLKDQAKFILKRNAQSSPEDLLSISYKYRSLLDSMKQNVRMLDKRLLSIFNDKQYNLYMDLCGQMMLQPIHLDRSVNEK